MKRSGLTQAVAVSCAGLSLSICGCMAHRDTPSHFRVKSKSYEIQSLKAAASAGDKEALFELGQRAEYGIDGKPDLVKSVKLYKKAASSSGGTRYLYVPAANGRGGATVPFYTGREVTGSVKAKAAPDRLGVR